MRLLKVLFLPCFVLCLLFAASQYSKSASAVEQGEKPLIASRDIPVETTTAVSATKEPEFQCYVEVLDSISTDPEHIQAHKIGTYK